MGNWKQWHRNVSHIDRGIKYNLLIYTYEQNLHNNRDPANIQCAPSALLAGVSHDLLLWVQEKHIIPVSDIQESNIYKQQVMFHRLNEGNADLPVFEHEG